MKQTNHYFLKYSAKDNMQTIRQAYNEGKNIKKETPEAITFSQAFDDIRYFQFIIENGYSGYGDSEKDCFVKAFAELKEELTTECSNQTSTLIPLPVFLNLIKKHFSFIFDGHLAITTDNYGIGFYKPLKTFVSSFFLKKHPGGFMISESNKMLSINNPSIKLFPTIKNGETGYLIGARSYSDLKTLDLLIDQESMTIPVHQIKSSPSKKITIQEKLFFDQAAYVKSSTFVGDNPKDLDAMYKTGKELRRYSNVIWDLSNNMGGNAEFAKQFIKGLSDCCSDSNKTYQLESSLVHAKETGQIQEIPYGFKEIKEYEDHTKPSTFSGHLHIIVNDSVASSAELAIKMTSCIENRTIYGCNTLGIGRFGDLLIYYLPYSKATVWCPHKIYENGIEEGQGYEPDVWLDTKDPLSHVLDIISNKKSLPGCSL